MHLELHSLTRALVCALLLGGALARADMGGQAAPPAEETPALTAWQPALLDVLLNAVSQDAPVLVLLADGDALLQPEVMERLRLSRIGGRRILVEGRPWVSLRSLDPLVRFEVDERALAIRLTAKPELLGKAEFDLSGYGRPVGLTLSRDPSGFLNYSVMGQTNDQLSAFAEAGGSVAGVLATTAVSRLANGQVVRGLSSASFDQPELLRRFTAGDMVAMGGPLGAAGVLGGIGVAREFSLDPYFVRGPRPRTTGLATTPSTVDVYVNGMLVRQQAVAPGTFELSHLPVTTGAGSIQTVVRDAFGRSEELTTRYYYSSGLLAKGLTDYAYQLGFRRDRFGSDSLGYTDPGFLARHRVGLTDQSTGGLRLEGGLDRLSGGASFTMAFPLGEIEASAAVSGQGPDRGTAGALGWSYFGRRLGGGAYVRAQSGRYATLTQSAADDRATLQIGAFGGVPLGRRLSMSLEYAGARYRETGASDSLSLRSDLQLGGAVALSLSQTLTRAGNGTVLGAFLSMIWTLGSRELGSAAVDAHQGAAASGMAGMQRSLPAGEGYGYRFQAGGQPGQGTANGLLQYQGPYGRYELGYNRVGRSDFASASVSGGLVAMQGRLFPTRAVQDGFALIQVPGVAGVRGYLNNQEVGRTNGDGNLLVPNLLPYHANKLSIRLTDVPMDLDVRETERLVATAPRGGAFARFGTERIQAVTGEVTVVRKGHQELPQFGEMRVAPGGPRLVSPLSKGGRFWFEQLTPGVHEAEVEYAGGRCDLIVTVPESRELLLDVGKLACSVAGSKPVARASLVSSSAP